ncbi:MAG: hypothetical protein JXA61_05350 [Bacteroidales bacterium]|nr:hypothetical protein [Bacteroidales bacterium]
MGIKPQLHFRLIKNYFIVLLVISIVLVSIEMVSIFFIFDRRLAFVPHVSQIMGYTLFGMISILAVFMSFVICHFMHKPFIRDYKTKGIVILSAFILSSITLICISYLNIIVLTPDYNEIVLDY